VYRISVRWIGAGRAIERFDTYIWQHTQLTRKTIQVKKIAFIVGLIAALLGGLWLLQGLGMVHVRPILCFADCDPVQGPSATWAVIGAFMLALGACAVFWSLKRRS
jgi:hypothetical protein